MLHYGRMAAPDNAIVDLATAIVKASCFLLTGDVSDAAATIADLVKGRVNDVIERRQIERTFDACADVVARRLRGLLDSAEYRQLPAHERAAAVLAVQETITLGSLGLQGLIAADLDAPTVAARLRPFSTGVLRRASLAAGGVELYRLVLRESCDYLVEAATTFPQFQTEALRELLGRQTSLADQLEQVLEQLPKRRGVNDFEVDYRRALVNRLDRMELFGVTAIGEASRRYPLSVAYLSLDVDDERHKGMRVEEALSGSSRTLITGEAGSGKTTLLRWLAVRAATGTFGGSLAGWNVCVPFFLPLRRYSDQALPAPARFVETVAANHAADMPQGWVNGLLRDGRALVLVDGVDEVHEGPRREEVRTWLDGLMADFPDARYVITSRTAALDDSWRSLDGTPVATLQPMSRSDVRELVKRWHEAVAERACRPLDEDERRMLDSLDDDRHVRQLAVSPLLAALLCALNREGSGLPHTRMEVYDAALEMLLGGRDRARDIPSVLKISPPLQRILLAELAYWLVQNGWSDVTFERAAYKLGQVARNTMGITADGHTLLRHLVERTGLLREPVQGRVDFVHKTFQEYLAGWAAVRADDIGQLVARSDDDQWRDVAIMAAGHASLQQANELVKGILDQSRDLGALLALACVQAAQQVDAGLRGRAEITAAEYIPPRNREIAEMLGAMGGLALELLNNATGLTVETAELSIRAAALTMNPDAYPVIVKLARLVPEARSEAMVCWMFFAPGDYLREVLLPTGPHERATVGDPSLLPYLPKLPGLQFLIILLDDESIALDVLSECSDLTDLILYSCRDLSVLRGLPHLRSLTVLQADTCDLSPLAGMPGLDVRLPSGSEVTGAHALGPGSTFTIASG